MRSKRIVLSGLLLAAPFAVAHKAQRADLGECAAAAVEEEILRHADDREGPVPALRARMAACEGEWSLVAPRNELELFTEIVRLASAKPDIHGLQERRWTGLGNSQVPLLVGAKPQRLPLVLVQCGLQCDLSSASILELLRTLYDEAPFHVLLLPSSSATSVIRLNGELLAGGHFEGAQLAALARAVRSDASPIRDVLPPGLISRVHVVGASLGGHAALYAAYYASLGREEPAISSALAACPVVDLESSIDALFNGQAPIDPEVAKLVASEIGFVPKNFSELYFAVSFAAEFARSWEGMPELKLKLLGGQESLTREAVLPLVAEQSLAAYAERAGQWPAVLTQPRSSAQYWGANDFRAFVGSVRVPTALWAAEDDMVVSARGNTALLSGLNPRVQTLISQRGSHCLYDSHFSHDITAAILRGLLVAQSPELRQARQLKLALYGQAHASVEESDELAPTDQLFGHEWLLRRGDQPRLSVVEHYLTSRDCLRDLTQTPADCFKSARRIFFAPEALGLNSADLRALPKAQVIAFNRWLNANARVVLSKDKTPIGQAPKILGFQLSTY